MAWRWTPTGLDAPGIGDLEADLRGGESCRWLSEPPRGASDPWRYGLDDQGRVRIADWPGATGFHAYQYEQSSIRRVFVADNGGIDGLEVITLGAGRYATAVSVDSSAWSYRSFEYANDKPLRIVRYGEQRDGFPAPGITEMISTFVFKRRGGLKDVRHDARMISGSLEIWGDSQPA